MSDSQKTDQLVVCVDCGGPWHQATGMLMGAPKAFPFCGRCWPMVMKSLQGYTRRDRFGGRDIEFYGPLPLAADLPPSATQE